MGQFTNEDSSVGILRLFGRRYHAQFRCADDHAVGVTGRRDTEQDICASTVLVKPCCFVGFDLQVGADLAQDLQALAVHRNQD